MTDSPKSGILSSLRSADRPGEQRQVRRGWGPTPSFPLRVPDNQGENGKRKPQEQRNSAGAGSL